MDWHPIRSAGDNPKESGSYWATIQTLWFGKYEYSAREVWFRVKSGLWQYREHVGTSESLNVIAWMPLPAPYRPEGGNKS